MATKLKNVSKIELKESRTESKESRTESEMEPKKVKSKKMNSRNWQGVILYLLAAGTSAFYSYQYIWEGWYYLEVGIRRNQIAMIKGVLLVLVLGGLCVYLFRYGKELRCEMKVRKSDSMHTEAVLVLMAIAGEAWYLAVHSTFVESSLFYVLWINGKGLMLTAVFVFFPLGALFLLFAVMLMRKILMGTAAESSLLYQSLHKMYCMLPFLKAILLKNSVIIAVTTLCSAAAVFFSVMTARSNGNKAGLWAAASILVILGSCASCYFGLFKNRVYKDTSTLLEQIHAMAEGTLDTSYIEEEDSLLHTGSKELHEIGGNLKQIMEKQMQSERMKIDLITNVSHDLKTPLTSMIGYIDLLKQEPLSDEARDYVEVLALKQEQLKDMIQDIFELSKSTSGTIQLEMEELDMKKLLDQTLADMEDMIQEHRANIRKRDCEAELKVLGDGKKLYRVFQNLIGNAVKYAMKGTRIYVETGKKERQIYVEVKNTASYEMDFSPEDIKERFARADESRNTEGHGLGIAIAESFTKNMGGDLHISIDGDQFKATVFFDGL